GLRRHVVGQIEVVVAPRLPAAGGDGHRTDRVTVRRAGTDVDRATGLRRAADADRVDAGEVGRVEGEPVVDLGEADVQPTADVLGRLGLHARVTRARGSRQAAGLGVELRLLLLGLQLDDLLAGERGDALGTAV